MDWFGNQQAGEQPDPFADLRPSRPDYSDGMEYGDSGQYGSPPYRSEPVGYRPPRHSVDDDGPAEPQTWPGYLQPAVQHDPASEPERARSVDTPIAGRTPKGSRLVSLGTAAVAVVLFGALAAGASAGLTALLGACVLAQLVFVAAWAYGTRRPGPWVVAIVGFACGLVADWYGAYGAAVSVGPFGYVMAGGILAAATGQLARGLKRSNVTESMGATMLAALATVAVPTLLVLFRHGDGKAGLAVTVFAAAAGVTVARLADVAVPKPRASLRVPRGAIGMGLGGLVASSIAGYAASIGTDLSPGMAAVCGLVVGLAAVLTDVGVSFGTAGRELTGDIAERWPARFLLGPAAAVAVAGLTGYVLGVLVLLPH